jgi:UDP-glucose 4-epimerase
VRDPRAVESALGTADRVFHLAAAVGVSQVAERPVETWDRNVLGSGALLSAASAAGVRTVLVSSSEVYGPGREDPLREDEPLRLDPSARRDVYALSKAAAEAYAFALHRQAALPVTVVRLFNAVGPGQSGRYGMVLPRFAAAARAGRPLPVHGDGTQRRCFLHVADAADALVALADSDAAIGRVVNVGSDEEVAIVDLARRVVEEAASRSTIAFVPFTQEYGDGFADFRRRRPDLSRVRALVGFRPRRTLRDAVRDVLAAPVAV